jgi:hypothetical protein
MVPFDPRFFDDSRWPRLYLRLAGTLSSQGHEECLAQLSGYLRRGERFVSIVDLTRVGLVPLEQRWRQVEWFEEHEQLMRETNVGTAIILTSPLVRLSISAILYFKRLPLPLAMVATPAEAEAWADARLKEAGLLQTGR